MSRPPTPADADRVEFQAHLFRTLLETLRPYHTPEMDAAVREWWLTHVLPGPSRYAAYDDGDWAVVWRELHDLRRLLNALADRKAPPPPPRRPLRGPETEHGPTPHQVGSRPFAGPSN